MKLPASLLVVGVLLSTTLPAQAAWWDRYTESTGTLLDTSLAEMLNSGYDIVATDVGLIFMRNNDGKTAACKLIINTGGSDGFSKSVAAAYPDAGAISQCFQLN